MSDAMNIDDIRTNSEEIIAAITAPAYVAAMQQLHAAPPADRLELAKTILVIEKLEAQGVKFPKGMRISSRYFETNENAIEMAPDGTIRLLKPSEEDLAAPGGANIHPYWGGCACGGGLTFCGGGGWSSRD